MRHLKTDYNGENIISGQKDSDILPGQQLMNLPPSNFRFDSVLCSPLKRCRATIALIPDSYISSVSYMSELLERNMGVLEGVNKIKARELYPSFFCGNKVDISANIPNGESVCDVQQRLKKILDYIRANHEKNILICSHNQTLKILYFAINGISITNDAWQCLNFPNGVLLNTSIIKPNQI